MAEDTGAPRATAAADGGVAVGRPARPAFLSSELDPTVFDEGFLRQLERLLLLARAPVRGGLKGGRRSVKRGQSVEFADYRDYSLGDDLRQLDWNVYARLEKLFVKLFVEEEDVTITILVDASASMASGRPEKLLFAKRAAAAIGYIGLASEDRVAVSSLGGRSSRRQTALRGSGRVFRLLSNLSAIQPADGPTDLVAAARHAAAQLHGRGVVVLLSDLLDPAAERVIRELAATGSGAGARAEGSADSADMPLTTPLALLGLLFVPAVVAMYLLKLRREETIVPSTLLWRRLVADLEANAPWQRLRRSLLLLVQLLLVIILVLLAARPFIERPAGLARDIVLVIDTSASMGATDVSPNRQAAARDAALAALQDLPTGGKVSVI